MFPETCFDNILATDSSRIRILQANLCAHARSFRRTESEEWFVWAGFSRHPSGDLRCTFCHIDFLQDRLRIPEFRARKCTNMRCTHANSSVRTHVHTHAHTHTHTHTHTHKPNARTRKRTHAHAHANARTRRHTYAHAHAHARTRTRTRTQLLDGVVMVSDTVFFALHM